MEVTAQSDVTPVKNCARRKARDRGVTLTELVITIALMGTLVAAVLTAVQTNIIASSRSRTAARVESVIVNVADRLNRAPKACDYTIYAQAAVLTEQWPASSVKVQQWYYDFTKYDADAGASGSWVGPSANSACAVSLTAPPDLLVQKIAVTVTSPDGHVSRTIEVVKSDV